MTRFICSYSFLYFFESDIPRIGWISAFLLTSVQRLCSTLFTGDFPRSWMNWRLSLANVCPELKICFTGEGPPGVWAVNRRLRRLLSSNWRFFFQISLTEKWHFGAKGSMNQSFDFFLLQLLNPVMIPEWPGFLSLINRLRVIECEELTFVHTSF